MYTLHHMKGCGSTAVEAVLARARAPYTLVEDPDLRRALNPLGQVPTLVLPSGEVMTESAAILVHLADTFPGLAPPAGSDARAHTLRWVVFLAVNVYGVMILGDRDDALRPPTDALVRRAWQIFEAAAPLSGEPDILGVYAAMISQWRPGRAWFAEHCPHVTRAVEAVEQDPTVAAVWARNF